MKKLVSILVVLAMTFALVACGSSASTKLTMGTGGTSGTYYGYGGVLGQYIKNKAGIDVTVVSVLEWIIPYPDNQQGDGLYKGAHEATSS